MGTLQFNFHINIVYALRITHCVYALRTGVSLKVSDSFSTTNLDSHSSSYVHIQLNFQNIQENKTPKFR